VPPPVSLYRAYCSAHLTVGWQRESGATLALAGVADTASAAATSADTATIFLTFMPAPLFDSRLVAMRHCIAAQGNRNIDEHDTLHSHSPIFEGPGQPCRADHLGFFLLTTRTTPCRRTTTEPGLAARDRIELRTFMI
jgi:hypothetical protein